MKQRVRMSRFRPPVRPKGDRFVVDLGADESALVRRLIGELRALLTDPELELDEGSRRCWHACSPSPIPTTTRWRRSTSA